MKKIFNNTYLKATLLVVFISIVSMIIYSSINNVTASDTVSIKQFNNAINELKENIEQTNNEINTLKEENDLLKSDLKEANEKITNLENKIKDSNTKIKKIDDRDIYFYTHVKNGLSSMGMSNLTEYILENMR